jgi:predicted Zn-dependent protease
MKRFSGSPGLILLTWLVACKGSGLVDPGDPVPTYGPCNQTPNYHNEVALNRWSSFPLAYFFDAATFPAEYLGDYQTSISNGIRRWDAATANDLGAVMEVGSPGEADFVINYREITPPDVPARTIHATGTPFLAGGEIVFNATAMAEPEELVRTGQISLETFHRGLSSIAAHEMGHLLGIIGHPSRNDVLMGLAFHDAPTVPDINTLIHAYCR